MKAQSNHLGDLFRGARWSFACFGLLAGAMPSALAQTHAARSAPFALDLRVAEVSLSTPTGLDGQGRAALLGPVSLSAQVAVGGVAKVEFWVDGKKINEATQAPYTTTWLPLYAGNSTVIVRAINSAGTQVAGTSLAVPVQHPIDRIEPDIAGPGLPTAVANAKRIMPYLEMRRVGTGPNKSGFSNLEFSPAMYDVRLGNSSPVDNGVYNPITGHYIHTLSLRMLAPSETIAASDFAHGGRFFLVAYARDAVGTGQGIYFPLPADAALSEHDANLVYSRRLSVSIPESYFNRLGLTRSGIDYPKLRLVRRSDLMVDADAELHSVVRNRLIGNTIPLVNTSTLNDMEARSGNRLVILLHGWQRDNSGDPYNQYEFKQLTTALMAEANSGSLKGWTVLGYNWSRDAATGGVVRDNNTFGLNSDSGSRAAAMGYQGGLALGHYLKNRLGRPGIDKIHLIAHSAGSWTAYGVLQQLRGLGLDQDSVQVTLLDPYMPSDTWAGDPFSEKPREQHLFLGKEMWSGLTNLSHIDGDFSFIRRIENYYARDVSGTGTEQIIAGSRYANGNIGVIFATDSKVMPYGIDIPPGAGHGGPLRFYADSINLRYPEQVKVAEPGVYLNQKDSTGWTLEWGQFGWSGSPAMRGGLIPVQQAMVTAGAAHIISPGTYKLLRGSDAAIGELVEVPTEGALLAFRYSFAEAGPGDRLVVRITHQGGTDEIWSYSGTDFIYDGFLTSGEVSLDAYKGQEVAWEFRLRAVSGQYSEVSVSDIRFFRRPFALSETNEPFVSMAGGQTVVSVGSKLELSATVLGPGPMNLRWQRNGTDLPATWYGGATNGETLVLSALAAGANGSYRLAATNPFGTAYGAEVVLEVDTNSLLPALTVLPQSQTLQAGAVLNLGAGAVSPSGGGALSYQWFKDGEDLPDQTGTTYQVAAVNPSHAGLYWAQVSNSAGMVETGAARVEVLVNTAPQIVVQPVSAEVVAGGSVALSVVATGFPAPTYEWRKYGVALSDHAQIEGSQTPVLILRQASAAFTEGPYTVVVSNAAGEVTSQSASVSVVNRSIALSGDLNFGKVTVGQTAKRTMTITNSGIAPLTVEGISYPVGFGGDSIMGTIPAGESVLVTVRFTPTALQSYGGNIEVLSDATSGPSTLAVTGTGEMRFWPGSSWGLPLFGPSEPGVRYFARGLPAGLKLSPFTGEISGSIAASARAGTYVVEYWTQVGTIRGEVSQVAISVESFPPALVGGFDGLLDRASSSVVAGALLRITVNRSGAFTGTLAHADTGRNLPVRGQLVVTDGGGAANALVPVALTKTERVWLAIHLEEGGASGALLSDPVSTQETTPAQMWYEGNLRKRGVFSRAAPPPWAGRYTGVFRSGTTIRSGEPEGASHATFVISATGGVTMRGRAADGSTLTAAYPLAKEGQGAFLINPHRRAHSGFGGVLQWELADQELPARAVVAAGERSPRFRKAAGPKDANYRAGFRSMSQVVTIRQWVQPARGQQLDDVFPSMPAWSVVGLHLNGAGLSNVPMPGPAGGNPYALPAGIMWSPKGNTLTTEEYNPTKFTARINPTTGELSGSFQLADQVTNSGRTTNVVRKVAVSGVLLRRGPNESGSFLDLAGGHFVVPPLTRGAESRTGRLRVFDEIFRLLQLAPLEVKAGDVLTLNYNPNGEIRRSVWTITGPNRLRAVYSLFPRGTWTVSGEWEQLKIGSITSRYRTYGADETLTVDLVWSNASSGTWVSDDGFSGTFHYKRK